MDDYFNEALFESKKKLQKNLIQNIVAYNSNNKTEKRNEELEKKQRVCIQKLKGSNLYYLKKIKISAKGEWVNKSGKELYDILEKLDDLPL